MAARMQTRVGPAARDRSVATERWEPPAHCPPQAALARGLVSPTDLDAALATAAASAGAAAGGPEHDGSLDLAALLPDPAQVGGGGSQRSAHAAAEARRAPPLAPPPQTDLPLRGLCCRLPACWRLRSGWWRSRMRRASGAGGWPAGPKGICLSVSVTDQAGNLLGRVGSSGGVGEPGVNRGKPGACPAWSPPFGCPPPTPTTRQVPQHLPGQPCAGGHTARLG